MRTRQRGNNPEEAKSNLTSFLDLIFNILAFFVMTFSPPSLEKNFNVELPPPKISKDSQTAGKIEGFVPKDEEKIFNNMKITLTANPEGALAGIRIEDYPVANLTRLTSELKQKTSAISDNGGDTMDAAIIVASPTLKYEHVLAAVDACYRANISQIGFSQALK